MIACLRLLESAANARWASGAAFERDGEVDRDLDLARIGVERERDLDLVARRDARARAVLGADRDQRPPAAHADLAAVAVVADRDVHERLLAAVERVDDLRWNERAGGRLAFQEDGRAERVHAAYDLGVAHELIGSSAVRRMCS